MIDLTLPLRLATSGLNLREHWAVRHARTSRQKQLAIAFLRRGNVRPVLAITITRLAPRSLDSDNLAGACKAVRDGIASFLRIDDGSPLVEWHYAQTKSKEYGCRIQIERVEAA